mgnify:CR=1 FL=1
MRQYPIWNEIDSCAYASNKSYGVKNTGEVRVKIGTSASNSWTFLDHVVTVRQHSEHKKAFSFYVDKWLIKQAILDTRKKEMQFSKGIFIPNNRSHIFRNGKRELELFQTMSNGDYDKVKSLYLPQEVAE